MNIIEEKPLPRVLIVGDDAGRNEALAVRLAEEGYDIVEAANGPDALESVRRNGADVVLLEIHMEGMDGFEVMERLQSVDSPPSVILVSEGTGVDYRLKGLRAGAADYITKPFDVDEVIARVANVLRQRLALRSARAEAGIDPGTGLLTHVSFERFFQQETALAKRHGRPMALVLVDADGLAKVNERYGRNAGNHYIGAIGQAVAATCRASDFGGRLGGGGFEIILPETDTAGTAQFLIRLWQNLSAARVHLATAPHSIKVSASMGFGILGVDVVDATGLWNAAVDSLAHAKQIPGVPTERRMSA